MAQKISRYDNWSAEIQGTQLCIMIELDESKVEVAPSGSGKTEVIATTGGAARVTGLNRQVLQLNLTLYKKG